MSEERELESNFLPLIVAHCLARNVDLEPILRTEGITLPVRPSTPVRPQALARVAAEAARLLDDPHFGLRLALLPPRGFWGTVELTARAAPTVGDGMTRIARYSTLVSRTHHVSWHVAGDEAVCQWSLPDLPAGAGGRHLHEFCTAILFRALTELAGDGVPIAARRVWFAHRLGAPDEMSEAPARVAYSEFFGTRDFAFGQELDGFAIDRSVARRATASGDPKVLDTLEAYALAQLPTATRFIDDLERAIARSMVDGPPTLEAAAKRLASSCRTLQRRLLERGITFRDVVDRVRRELAKRHVEEGSLGLGEIAFLLGYSDGRAFARAFQRWCGTSPSTYRLRTVRELTPRR